MMLAICFAEILLATACLARMTKFASISCPFSEVTNGARASRKGRYE